MKYTIIIRQTISWGSNSMIALAKKEEGKEASEGFQCGVETGMNKGGYGKCRVQNVNSNRLYDNAVVDDRNNQFELSKVYTVILRMNKLIKNVKASEIDLTSDTEEYLNKELQSLPVIGSDENILLRAMKVLEILENIINGPQNLLGKNEVNIEEDSYETPKLRY